MGGDAMTINLEEIYDQYRKADFTDRLNIYLQFPELRNEFFEIEQKGKQPFFFETAKSQSKRLNRINRWISRRFSLLW
jgi:hypothetical protein